MPARLLRLERATANERTAEAAAAGAAVVLTAVVVAAAEAEEEEEDAFGEDLGRDDTLRAEEAAGEAAVGVAGPAATGLATTAALDRCFLLELLPRTGERAATEEEDVVDAAAAAVAGVEAAAATAGAGTDRLDEFGRDRDLDFDDEGGLVEEAAEAATVAVAAAVTGAGVGVGAEVAVRWAGVVDGRGSCGAGRGDSTAWPVPMWTVVP